LTTLNFARIDMLTMLSMLVFIASTLQILATENSVAFQPGSIYLWSWNQNVPSFSNKFVTRNVESSDAISSVLSALEGFELVVLLSANDQQKMTTCSHVSNALSKAPIQQGINYVYPENNQKLADSLMKQIDTAHTVRRMPLPDLEQEIKSNPGMLSDGKVDLIHAFTSDAMFDLASSELLQSDKRVLFIAIDEPQHVDKLEAKKSRRLGSFSRILSTTSSNIIDGIYYKPEGAEYSIYYADTYLYITPDIFTGLMTFLFFTTVALLGLSCLGSIQGMSSFYDKLPVVGKEA